MITTGTRGSSSRGVCNFSGGFIKIGGYGFIRFSWPLLPEASEYFGPFIQILSLLAIIYGSLTTCRQVDLKRT